MQALGFTAKEVIPILEDVGNAVAAAGGGNERLERVVLALSQIRAKGRVQAQELLQLAEAGIPSLKILEKELGKSTAEIQKMVEAGEVGADRFFEAFQKFSKANFGGLMREQSRTLLGAWSNIQDTIKVTAAVAFEPYFEEIRRIAVRTADELETADFSQITPILTQKLSESVGAAIRVVAGNAARDFGEQFKKDLSDILSGDFDLFEGLKRDLPAVAGLIEGLFGANSVADRINEIEAALLKDIRLEKQRAGQLSETAKQAKESQDALKGLVTTTDDSIKRNEKLADVYRESSNWLSVFKNNSQEAATMQKLLAIDVDAVSSSLGQQALAAARATDALQLFFDRQRDDANRRGDANTAYLQESAALIERISQATTELKLKAGNISPEVVAKTALEQSVSNLRQQVESLSKTGLISPDIGLQIFKNITDAEAALKSFGSEFDAFQKKQRESKFEKFYGDLVETGTKAIEEIKLAYDSLGEGANLGKLTAGQIQELRNEMERVAFVRENSKKLTEEQLKLALVEIDYVNKQKVIYANLAEAKQKEKETSDNYSGIIDELNSQLERSNALTTEEITLKKLLKIGITDLNSERAKEALVIAKQVDEQKEAIEKAKEAKEAAKQMYEQTKGFFTDILNAGIQNGWDGILQSLKNKIKQFLVDMAAEWLASKFFKLITGQTSGGSSGGSSSGGFGGILDLIFGRNRAGSGGTPPFVGNFGSGGNYSDVGSIGSSGRLILDPSKVGISDRNGGFLSSIFGKGGIFGDKGFGNNTGTYGAIGTGAALLGGLIGGRAGGAISGAGSGLALGASIGSIVPGVGTAIGAAVGAIAGGLFGLFGGDKKRKADKTENIPALQKGFADALAQMREIVEQTKSINLGNVLSFNEAEITAKVAELRSQIAGGFGVQFQSKKYKKVAQQQISQKLAEFDQMNSELQTYLAAARTKRDQALMAQEIDSRLRPNFASGVYMDTAFARQFTEYKRRNGMLAGAFTGRDTLPSMLAPGEMVLNPMQIAAVISAAGFDPFKFAKIPNYAEGTYVAPQTTTPAQSSFAAAPQTAPVVNLGGISILIEQSKDGDSEAKIKEVLINGLKSDTDLRVELVKAYDKEKPRVGGR